MVADHGLPYTVLDLFAGIGGFSLGLERTGAFKTELFCEIDPFCQKVLRKHWPDVPIHEDITTLHGETGQFDVLTGGFPCQDLSYAGKGAGIEGERSGLWSEFARLIREIRPKFIIVENVPALLNRGMGVVLGDLAKGGYDAEWQCLPAAAFGAPHIRDRVWVLAYPRRQLRTVQGDGVDGFCGVFPERNGRAKEIGGQNRELVEMVPGVHTRVAANWWRAQSRVARSTDGVPDRLERLTAIGNAIVPQISEWLGQQILTTNPPFIRFVENDDLHCP